MQQKHALGGPSAACLLPHVAPLQQQLLAFLARDGLKAKHLLLPLKLAHALLRALRSAQAAPAASVGEAIMGALEALQLKHPEATSRGAVGGQCRKLQALAEQAQSNAPLPGGGKKANKKAKA